MILYHYTCAHGAGGIQETGDIRPHRQPLLGEVGLVWLTDMEHPDAAALGLTSHMLRCDRTEYRITGDTLMSERWTRYARRLPMETRRALELAPGARPAHWWVSLLPVHVLAVDRVA